MLHSYVHRGLAHRSAARASRPASIARAQVDLGRAHLALGDTAAAIRSLRDALAYWDRHGPERSPAAEAAGWLALALHAAGEHTAAQDHAKRAGRGEWRTEVDRISRLQQSLAAAGLAPVAR